MSAILTRGALLHKDACLYVMFSSQGQGVGLPEPHRKPSRTVAGMAPPSVANKQSTVPSATRVKTRR